ncbi:MAG: hypothetical protein GEV10_22815 [Streptosporangiales bacterium]|nr:hypothetical protein [Streptosporangiales bacterium]
MDVSASGAGTGRMIGELEIRVLGPVEARRGGRPVPLATGRQRTLLAVLAMSAGEVLSAETIGDRIWGEVLPVHLRRSVQTLVTRLRQAVGSDAVATAPHGYRLTVEPGCVDAARFLRLVEPAPVVRSVADERADLVRALALWRGAPFEGVNSDWLRGVEAPRLLERQLAVVERRIDLDLAAGRHAELVTELGDLTNRHPLRESLWCRLLEALDRCGRQAEVLERYEAVRGTLRDELGADPGPGLRAIHARLLSRTLAEPVQTIVPRQLPPDVPRFTGREDEVEALDALLPASAETPVPMIATVHGAGGMGKSALAVHWAHRVGDLFPDGQLYLDLRGHGPGPPVEPADALLALLRGLGVADDRIPGGLDARSAQFRSLLAERRMLVVLDDARDADQVRPLLVGSRCLVLVTSRRQLRGLVAREGAHRIALGPLAPAASVALLAATLGPYGVAYDSAQLAELARLCGHLPLALGLAGEHATRQPTGLASFIAELRHRADRLDLLEVGAERGTRVRDAVAWSYRELAPRDARTFRLLGRYPRTRISRTAAAALVGVSSAEVRLSLDRLLDVHLVDELGPGSYEIHELFQLYAAELAARVDGGGSAPLLGEVV